MPGWGGKSQTQRKHDDASIFKWEWRKLLEVEKCLPFSFLPVRDGSLLVRVLFGKFPEPIAKLPF
jgi:hypothetical protein